VNTVLTGFPTELKAQINEVLDRAASDAAVLADAVAQQFVQDTSLRLQLLSESSLEARYDYLFCILDELARES
jgi:hypothetical protein